MPVIFIKGSKTWTVGKEPPLVIHGQHPFFQNPERPGANGLTVAPSDYFKHIPKSDQWVKNDKSLKPVKLTALEIEAVFCLHVQHDYPDDMHPDDKRPVRTVRVLELQRELKSLKKKGVVLEWPEPEKCDRFRLGTLGHACFGALRELGAVPQDGE